MYEWVSSLEKKLSAEQLEIVEEILKELCARLQFFLSVKLHYLTLDRPAPTLSGVEGQRIRLASQLGSGLVGVLYILDEPSIGLHARDHRALLDTLIHLHNLGNTVLVVEHDEETMKAVDWLIDLGPRPGILGGKLVAAGPPDDVMTNPESLTGHYLSGKSQITTPNHAQRRMPSGWLQIVNARLHNLKNLDGRIPHGVLVCITGVSGSGKSSLISKTLYPALARTLQNTQSVPGPYDHIEGLDQLDKVINITQKPIGRTSRSNPGTYVKVFDAIRKVFATTPEAKARGYKADLLVSMPKMDGAKSVMVMGRRRLRCTFPRCLGDLQRMRWTPLQSPNARDSLQRKIEHRYFGDGCAGSAHIFCTSPHHCQDFANAP